MPALYGLIPPHGPFPAGKPVDLLEIHQGTKAFNVIHQGKERSRHHPFSQGSCMPEMRHIVLGFRQLASSFEVCAPSLVSVTLQ
jgi:hypothetical protein